MDSQFTEDWHFMYKYLKWASAVVTLLPLCFCRFSVTFQGKGSLRHWECLLLVL